MINEHGQDCHRKISLYELFPTEDMSDPLRNMLFFFMLNISCPRYWQFSCRGGNLTIPHLDNIVWKQIKTTACMWIILCIPYTDMSGLQMQFFPLSLDFFLIPLYLNYAHFLSEHNGEKVPTLPLVTIYSMANCPISN